MNGLTPSDTELTKLLLADTPLIDVRAPVEFKKGSIPGAVNLPLLNDEERAAVGTAYKRQGQAAAIALGHALISGDVREARMQAWQEFARLHPSAWIYCFRGGLRSQSVQQALKEAGVTLPVLSGGYKRARNFLLAAISKAAKERKFIVVSGYTGAGKTVLLRELAKRGLATCDLEHHARHRGSSFGKLSSSQPSQVDFENTLALHLMKIEGPPPERPILIEDESRLIGRVEIPEAVFCHLQLAPVYVIESPVEDRARHLISIYLNENYGLSDGERPKTGDGHENLFARMRQDLKASLHGIQRRLGGADTQAIDALMDEAFARHEATGEFDSHVAWVSKILVRYYDPLYDHHLERIQHRIVARGSKADISTQLASTLC
jgi:tRNA 2-selenouridine synthase